MAQPDPLAIPTACVEGEPYALRVTDHSMAPEFPKDCIVVVDPTGTVRDGAFVVAATESGLVLRELRIRGSTMSLECYAPEATEVPVDSDALRGVVVQRAGRRRHMHKRY